MPMGTVNVVRSGGASSLNQNEGNAELCHLLKCPSGRRDRLRSSVGRFLWSSRPVAMRCSLGDRSPNGQAGHHPVQASLAAVPSALAGVPRRQTPIATSQTSRPHPRRLGVVRPCLARHRHLPWERQLALQAYSSTVPTTDLEPLGPSLSVARGAAMPHHLHEFQSYAPLHFVVGRVFVVMTWQ